MPSHRIGKYADINLCRYCRRNPLSPTFFFRAEQPTEDKTHTTMAKTELAQSIVREFYGLVQPQALSRGPWTLKQQQQHWSAALQVKPLLPLCTGGTFTCNHKQQVRWFLCASQLGAELACIISTDVSSCADLLLCCCCRVLLWPMCARGSCSTLWTVGFCHRAGGTGHRLGCRREVSSLGWLLMMRPLKQTTTPTV